MGNKEAFFYSRFLFWGFGLSLILNVAGTGFWISELLGAVLSFLILALVKKTNNALWFKRATGFIFAFLATIVIANLGGTMYLKQTPNVFLVSVPLICGFIVSKTRETPFKKTIFILFVYSLFMFFASSGILANHVNLENLLPQIYDIKGVLLGAVIFILTSVTPILCLNDYKDKKSVLLNYATGALTVLVMSFLVVSVLGAKEAILYRYPEFVLLKRIKIYEFFSNVENLFVIMIVTDFISTIATGFRNMKLEGKGTSYIPLVLVIILSTIACNHSKIMTTLYWYYPILLFLLLIPTFFPKK